MNIKELLTRGVTEIINKEEIEKALKTKKKLRIKFGIDPTAPDIHLGHTVPLRKLKQFQDLGHEIILIIGDFTATIGDPSGRLELRKPLAREQIKEFMKDYKKEISKIIDFKKAEIRYNSEWYDRLGAMFLYELTSKITVARAIERDDFRKRLRQDQDVSLLEIIYPLLQGYDSVEVKADLEIGGTDQKFNLLMGRKIQKRYGLKEQNIMTLQLLEGTDGVRKMSKSYGNYIGIFENPQAMFGKIMSIPDSLIVKYFRLLTDVSDNEIDKIKEDLQNVNITNINPRDFKIRLALEIITMYHGAKEAQKAKEEFEKVFTKREVPKDIPIFKIKKGQVKLIDLLLNLKLVSSKSEAKRLIEQGAVDIDGVKISDKEKEIVPKKNMVLKVGKRKWARIS